MWPVAFAYHQRIKVELNYHFLYNRQCGLSVGSVTFTLEKCITNRSSLKHLLEGATYQVTSFGVGGFRSYVSTIMSIEVDLFSRWEGLMEQFSTLE